MTAATSRPARVARPLAYVLLGLFVVVLVVHAVPVIRRPFGPSHDGVNGSVWGSGSRALRTEGVLWSRMGTRSLGPDGVRTYANHPPLLVVEAAIAEEVLGEHPWSTRLPALAATVIAILAAVGLLRTVGVQLSAAVAGVALGFGVPMIGVYGTMLDTPMVGLAPAVVLLWLDARGRNGLRTPGAVIGITAAVCVLSSWEGVVVAGMLCAMAVVRMVRKRTCAHDWSLLCGAVVGLAALVAWLWWAYGSWAPLADQLHVRSGFGARPRTLSDVIHALRDDAGGLFPVWVAALGLVAFGVGLRDRRTRVATAISLGTVVLWVFGFRDGAVIHDYWPYWAVLPLTIGFGALVDWLVRRPVWSEPLLVGAAVAVTATALGSVGLTTSVVAGQQQAFSASAGRLLVDARWPPTQHTAWFVDTGRVALDWASYDARRRAEDLKQTRDLQALAVARPSDLVLFLPGAPAPGHPCSNRIDAKASFALLPAADVAHALDGDVIRRC